MLESAHDDPSDTPQRDRHDDLSATIERARALGQRALSLRHRGLDTLPAALGTLEALLELDLTDNLLTDIGAPVLALTGLEFLTLARNRLTALPDGLWTLTALKDLDIGNAVSLRPDQRYGARPGQAGNAVETLPAGLGALTRLRRLGAGFVGLSGVPAEIGALGDLLMLELPGNRISALPAELNALTSLETLDLSGNPLGDLPDALAGLGGLRRLNLSDVATPPAVAPLTGLERLALAGCGLDELPGWVLALPGLTSLYLAGNPMIDLPEGIAALGALSYLDLSGTGITEPPRHLDLPAGLIVRLGPRRLYQDDRFGHVIGPDGTVVTLERALEDDDEDTETDPIPSVRPRASDGLGGAGGVVIHRRAGPAAEEADETPTRIVRKATPPPAEPNLDQPKPDVESQTRRGAPAKGGLAARVQAAVAERDASEQGAAAAPRSDGDGETGARPPAVPPATPIPEEPGRTRRNAPTGGLAARVQAAVESREDDAPVQSDDAGPTDGGPTEAGPTDDADKTQMGRRAAARSGHGQSQAPIRDDAGGDGTGGDRAGENASGDEQEETVSQPRDADGRPIRKPKSD